MSTTSETFQPLAGVRVIEMSHMIMGPSCGMFLAALGAEVIKVEPPGGDKTRQLTGMGSPFFPLFNRGKKSVQLDLGSVAGQQALHKLLASADVFLENFRDASLSRMGADLTQMRARHPQLIIASHKGFLAGPYEHRTAMDEVVQMMTGLAYMTGPSGRPLRVGSSANDIMGGLFGAFAIVLSLLERRGTGQGRDVRIGLFENCLLLVAQHMVQYELEGVNPPPMPERVFSWPVYDIFTTADGQQIFVSAVTTGQWTALCDILGLEMLKTHPALQTKMDTINARHWTLPLIQQAIAKQPCGVFSDALEAQGISYSLINKPGDMFNDPHVLRDGGLAHSRTADGRHFRAPALPFAVDGYTVTGAGDAPELGADTVAVLAALGLNDEEIRVARGGAMGTTMGQ